MSTEYDQQNRCVAVWPGRTAGVVLLGWYLWTMPTGLMFFDAGELALVGAQLGLGHPPGQPLYTLLLGLCTRIWPGDPLVAMNALSAIASAACALPVDHLMRRSGQIDGRVRASVLIIFGLAYPIWDQAARIELYALSTVCVLAAMSYAARVLDEEQHGVRSWFVLGILVGLTACINAVHGIALAVATGLAAVPALWRQGPTTLLGRTGIAAIGASVGCLPYLHLAWVAGKTDRFVWGDLSTQEGLSAYMLGADYAHTDHSSWSHVGSNFMDWLAWASLHGVGPLFVLGFAGLLLNSWSRTRAALWVIPLVVASGFSFTYGVFYPDVPDFSAYLLPTLWWMAIGVAANLTLHDGALKTPVLGALTLGAMVLALVFGTHLNRSQNDLAREISRTWLASLPERSVLLVESDHLVFPMMYLQAIENVRPDVVVLNVGFSASRWYWNSLFRTHDDLEKIEIKAGSRPARLRSFLLANRDRPHFAEGIELAGRIQIRPCLSTWGIGLGHTCSGHTGDGNDIFSRQMSAWWLEHVSNDPISTRVLANLGLQRGQAAAAMGHYGQALMALRDGVPPAARPPGLIPLTKGEAVQFPALDPSILIGHPLWNLRVGETLLKNMDIPESEQLRSEWRNAVDHPILSWF